MLKKIANFIVDKKNIIFIITFLISILSVWGTFHVNVNYDMSSYLPDDSKVKKGMKVMSEEFGEMSVLTVMFDDLNEEEQLERKSELEQFENVKSVTYFQDDETYQKENHSKYLVTVSANTYSNDAKEVLNKIREKYGDKVYISGAIVDNDLMVTTLMDEMPIIILIAVIFIFIILFILCETWIEPFLYMTCIGIAVLINMGTNSMLESVSFMTFAIAALLQMGLSMDYSIMLMNRYEQEKTRNDNAKEAMKIALKDSFGAISGSSVTTIVGLLALIFMSFKIGKDMGIVLAKGVFISLICIFTILPGLVVSFNKLMEKTRKKVLNFNTDPIMKFVEKTRFIIIPIILIIVVGAFLVKDNLGIIFVKTFDNSQQDYIEKIFGIDNQIVLLYEKDEKSSNIDEVVKFLESQENVNSVQDYSNTIGKEYNYKELSEEMGIDVEQAKMMYQMYKDKNETSDYESITVYDLIVFLDDNIVSNPAYASVLSDEQKTQIIDTRKELEDGKAKIANAEKEISNGEKEIADNEKKLKDGENQLVGVPEQLAEAERKIQDSESQIVQSENQLATGEKQIKENEEKITAGEQQIAVAEEELSKKEKELEAGEIQLQEAEKQFEIAKSQMLEQGMTEDEINETLSETIAQINEQKGIIEAGKEQLELGKAEIEKQKATIKAGKEELEKAKAELEAGRAQLESGKAQLEAGKAELANGKSEYEAGKKQIEDGRVELENGKKELLAGKKELADSKKIYEEAMNSEELSEAMDLDIQDVTNMLKIKRISNIDVESDILTLEEFLNYICDDILTNETYSKAISEDMRKDIEDGKIQIDENKALLLAQNDNRMIISINLPSEGDDTFEFIEKINDKLSNTLEHDNYLIGDSVMGYEMDDGFIGELNFVTLLTIIAILVVVVFTLHSIVGSVILVAIIQGAVYIVTAICVFQGKSINYIALILVQCILMGATIDYGILFICNYIEQRKNKNKNKHDALCIAMRNSIKTILTSSLILFSCCSTVGILMTQKALSQTCTIIAYGTVCAVIMVIFVLSSITLIMDRFIVKK